jgi:hypothetical protein
LVLQEDFKRIVASLEVSPVPKSYFDGLSIMKKSLSRAEKLELLDAVLEKAAGGSHNNISKLGQERLHR